MKLFIILGALNAMMAVGTGAFGAHGLQGKISDALFISMGKSNDVSNVPWLSIINYRCN